MLPVYLSSLDTDEERDIFSQYYHQYSKMLKRIAMNYLHNDGLAEDAVHNTFLATIRHKEKIILKTAEDFRFWCVLILRRVCVDMLRRNKHYDAAVCIDDENGWQLADGSEPVDIIVSRSETYDILAQTVAGLDESDRRFLEMKYANELSLKEIGEILALSPTQVNGKLARARAKLRKILEKEGFEA